MNCCEPEMLCHNHCYFKCPHSVHVGHCNMNPWIGLLRLSICDSMLKIHLSQILKIALLKPEVCIYRASAGLSGKVGGKGEPHFNNSTAQARSLFPVAEAELLGRLLLLLAGWFLNYIYNGKETFTNLLIPPLLPVLHCPLDPEFTHLTLTLSWLSTGYPSLI